MTDYVKFFRETSPYIHRHRGKTFVIALPGEAVCHTNFTDIIHDIALLNTLGIRIVLVHGARPQVAQRLEQCQLESQYAANIPVTDSRAMECVKDAVGSVRITIESLLSMGLANSPMHGARIRVVSGNFITAKPLGIREGVDFQHSGEVRKIDRTGIQGQLNDGAMVLLSAIGYSPTGEAFNLGYEDVATQAAINLGAEKLIFLGPESGLNNASGSLLKRINLSQAQRLLEKNEDNSLNNTLQGAYQACLNGVPRCHLTSYSADGDLLGELFTREGTGTLVLQHSEEVIRQASIDDITGILELISPLEEQGVLVKRSRELLETEISRFYVIAHPEGMLIGCAALYPFAAGKAAELACVVTHPDFHNLGLAARLLEHLEDKARNDFQLKTLYVLTTQAAHWFQENGFMATSLEQLPLEKAKLYNYQRKSKIFYKHLD
ncbi:amino-acid N-acetyltransferase [Gammaproteobacteria bacterium 53_120_T64]|nr:amino-acid N-acetyltransferase [Gammaproteobacteria bacterium 53_120_T64]